FEPEDVDTALADLVRAGLVDDQRFATELVRSRSGRRLAGSRLIRQELRQKGVAPQLVDEAVADAEGTEEDRAFRLAEQRAARFGRLDPDATARRLIGVLQRRGFGYDAAKRAAMHALAGMGWDPAGED
ncbi:MAG TPA: regulatory protein RecX, partial [Actinomycetota bacterium]|nr:regulatory protein RecX [Actinomycetota bacterium]